MARALLTLVAGILLAVLLTAVISGGLIAGPVLVTTAAGVLVMAVVAWRARIRERAQQLEDAEVPPRDRTGREPTHEPTPRSAERSTDEDTDRG